MGAVVAGRWMMRASKAQFTYGFSALGFTRGLTQHKRRKTLKTIEVARLVDVYIAGTRFNR